MSFGKNNYPPLVIFAYNRPKKLENLLLSLTQNKELEYIDVYFSPILGNPCIKL